MKFDRRGLIYASVAMPVIGGLIAIHSPCIRSDEALGHPLVKVGQKLWQAIVLHLNPCNVKSRLSDQLINLTIQVAAAGDPSP